MKPRQRLDLPYTVPRLRFDLTLTPVKMSLLTRLDEVLVHTVKRWLHLHPSTTTHLLYTSTTDGASSLPKFATEMPIAKVAALTGCLESDDPVIRSVAHGAGAKGERAYWLKAAGLPEPTPGSRHKPNWRKGEGEKWNSLEVQGVGVETWAGRLSNHVMRNALILRESNYIGLLKLRTSTFSVKATLARGRRNLDKSCRVCGYMTESQHVLAFKKDLRIKTHNHVCHLLARCAERGKISFQTWSNL